VVFSPTALFGSGNLGLNIYSVAFRLLHCAKIPFDFPYKNFRLYKSNLISSLEISPPLPNQFKPTTTRFRNKRLASGIGHTIHSAELNAAENALIRNAHLFSTFNLEETYLGDRIREYNEKVDGEERHKEEEKRSRRKEKKCRNKSQKEQEEASTSKEHALKPTKISDSEEEDGELPESPKLNVVKISSEEDSDYSD
jgi:hypothetical protein